jgi:Ca2+-binding EF-hand superfamily protein
VAIQDYVRSFAAETVSKDQVRFLEMQFARADKDHDGELDFDELAAFVRAVSCPETDQR